MDSKYLEFVKAGSTGKTEQWAVYSREHRFILGEIKWYPQWRQYCFYPSGFTIFNIGCMQDICQFIKNLMDKRKEPK